MVHVHVATYSHVYLLHSSLHISPVSCRRDLDVDEVMVDAAAEWKPVEKPPDVKDEDGILCI